MSEKLSLELEILSQQNAAESIKQVEREIDKLAKKLKNIQGIKDLAPGAKDLKAYQNINKALRETGTTWDKGIGRHMREAERQAKQGTLGKYIDGLRKSADGLEKHLSGVGGATVKLSTRAVSSLKALHAAQTLVVKGYGNESRILDQIAGKHDKISSLTRAENLRRTRYARNRQIEGEKELRLEERKQGIRSRIGGKGWGSDQNAHVRRYAQMARQQKTEEAGDKRRQNSFWKMQRERIRLLDRTDAADKRRIRDEERSRRRDFAERAKMRNHLKEQAKQAVHHGSHAVRSLSHPFFSSPAFMAMASLTGAIEGLRVVMEESKAYDKSLTDMKIRGGLGNDASEARGLDARRQASKFGVGSEHFLNIETESLSRGISPAISKQLGPMIMKFAESTGQRPEDAAAHTSEFLQQLLSMGQIKSVDDIRRTLNVGTAISNKYGGAEKLDQAMESGLAERGAQLGLNAKDTLLFGGLLNSMGARTGRTTTSAMGVLAEQSPNWKGEYQEALRSGDRSDPRVRAYLGAPRQMGYGNIDAMAQDAGGKNGLEGIAKFFSSFAKIEDDTQRRMIEQKLGFGQEVGGLLESFIRSPEKIAAAQRVANQAYGAADDDNQPTSQGQKSYRTGLEYATGVFDSVIENFATSVEQIFKKDVLQKLIPTWESLSDWAIDTLPGIVDDIIQGFIKGLGFDNIESLIKSLQDSFKGVDWKRVGEDVAAAAKGIGEGIAALGSGLKYTFGFISKITGDGSIEGLARIGTELFGLSLAVLGFMPVIGLMKSIGNLGLLILDIGGGLKTIASLDLVGGASGLMSLAGGLTAIVGAISALMASGVLQHFHMPWAGKGDDMSKFLWGTDKDGKSLAPSVSILGMHPFATDANPTSGLSANDYWAKKKSYMHLQSYEGGSDDYRSMISKASYSPSDSGEVVKDAMVDSSRTIVEVRDELIETNDLLKKSILGDVGGDGPHGGDAGSGGAPNMRYGRNSSGGRNSTPGGGSGGPTVSGGSGGSRSWRNNNPGNIEYGSYAKSMGAIGTDGRFAVFPDYASGRKAQEHLLFESKGYKDLTLAGAINKWAPGSENNVPAYIAAMGGDPNAKMSSFSPSQRSALLDAMQKHEGWKVGTRQNSTVGGGGAAVAMSGDAAERIQTMRKAGLLSDEQCVTLAMASVGIRKGSGLGGNVHDWRAGIGADSGLLKPGTPISTFLNRDGSQSDRYAGGGSGTPGAGLDHAGKFEKYIMDAAGKRIGFMMAEQYQGSHGVHDKEYYFGKGSGEHNGSNYRAVMAGGQGLGGDNNPLNVKIDPKSVASSANIAAKVAKPKSATDDDDSDFKKAGGQRADASDGGTKHHFEMHFHHGVQDPDHLASVVMGRVESAMNSRTHDVDHYIG